MHWEKKLTRLKVTGRHGGQWLVEIVTADAVYKRTLRIDENTSWLSEGHTYLLASPLPKTEALTSTDLTFLWPGQGLYFAMDLEWNSLTDEEAKLVSRTRSDIIQKEGFDGLETLYLRHCRFAVDTTAHRSMLAFVPITNILVAPGTVPEADALRLDDPPVKLVDGIYAVKKPLVFLSHLYRADFFSQEELRP